MRFLHPRRAHRVNNSTFGTLCRCRCGCGPSVGDAGARSVVRTGRQAKTPLLTGTPCLVSRFGVFGWLNAFGDAYLRSDDSSAAAPAAAVDAEEDSSAGHAEVLPVPEDTDAEDESKQAVSDAVKPLAATASETLVEQQQLGRGTGPFDTQRSWPSTYKLSPTLARFARAPPSADKQLARKIATLNKLLKPAVVSTGSKARPGAKENFTAQALERVRDFAAVMRGKSTAGQTAGEVTLQEMQRLDTVVADARMLFDERISHALRNMRAGAGRQALSAFDDALRLISVNDAAFRQASHNLFDNYVDAAKARPHFAALLSDVEDSVRERGGSCQAEPRSELQPLARALHQCAMSGRMPNDSNKLCDLVSGVIRCPTLADAAHVARAIEELHTDKRALRVVHAHSPLLDADADAFDDPTINFVCLRSSFAGECPLHVCELRIAVQGALADARRPFEANGVCAAYREALEVRSFFSEVVVANCAGEREALRKALAEKQVHAGMEHDEQLALAHHALEELDRSLENAVKSGSIDEVTKRLCEGADPLWHDRDYGGNTALHWAAMGNHHAALKLLVRCGADVNATGNLGTPLIAASCQDPHRTVAHYETACNKVCDTVQLLLDLGASVAGEEGQHAMHVARLDSVKLLLRKAIEAKAM